MYVLGLQKLKYQDNIIEAKLRLNSKNIFLKEYQMESATRDMKESIEVHKNESTVILLESIIRLSIYGNLA